MQHDEKSLLILQHTCTSRILEHPRDCQVGRYLEMRKVDRADKRRNEIACVRILYA